MARNTLWITIASILAVFDITDPVDAAGKPLTVEDNLEYTTSLSRPVNILILIDC
jgi:hypothetical protein